MALCLAILLISADLAAGQTVATSAKKPEARSAAKIPIQQYKLKNGLRVVLSEDHSAPTYSICVTYDVGSRDEKAGHTGFAHLFEHMMFPGLRKCRQRRTLHTHRK